MTEMPTQAPVPPLGSTSTAGSAGLPVPSGPASSPAPAGLPLPAGPAIPTVPPAPTQVVGGAERISCPECGELAEVQPGRRRSEDFCRRCDFPLFWARAAVISPFGEEASASLRRLPGTVGRAATAGIACPHCGEPNSPAALICVRCGGDMHPVVPPPPPPVVVYQPPPPPPPPVPEKTSWLWLIIIGICLVLIVVAVVWGNAS